MCIRFDIEFLLKEFFGVFLKKSNNLSKKILESSIFVNEK